MGFIASVRPQWKIRVNVDITCKAFFPSGNLSDILYSKYGDDIENPARWNSVEYDIKRLRVEGRFYKTPEGKSFARRFTIFAVSKVSAKALMIEGKNISVDEYFKEHHNIQLKYPGLPCIKVRICLFSQALIVGIKCPGCVHPNGAFIRASLSKSYRTKSRHRQ